MSAASWMSPYLYTALVSTGKEEVRMHGASCEALVALIRSGNSDAVDVLFNRWFPKMVEFCSRRLESYFVKDRAREAEDEAQEIMVKCFDGLDRFRRDAKFATWLYRIANNHIVDRHRRGGLGRPVDLAEVEWAGCAGSEANAFRGVLFRELLEGCVDEGGARDETYAMVCLWVFGLTYREIGKQYGRSVDVVAGRIRRRVAYVAERIRGGKG